MNRLFFSAALTAAIFFSSCTSTEVSRLSETAIDFTGYDTTEILKLDNFSGMPDKDGTLKSYSVTFPEFEELVYFGSDGNK